MVRYSLFQRRKTCKFSGTLYNRQLISLGRIPVEFVVHLLRYQNCVELVTLSMAA